MKNPFKKQAIVDTVINVGIGGAANVAMNYAFSKIDALASLGDTTKKAIKIAVGALAGTMTTNKYLRAAADGIATVGASELISDYLPVEDAEGAAGLPYGMIGRAGVRRLGNKAFKKKVAGVAATPSAFMDK